MEFSLVFYHWNWLKWHDKCSKFHDDQFRHLSNVTVITATIWEAVMLVLLIKGTYGVCHWDGFIWHDIHTEVHEDWYMYSSSMKGFPQKIEKLWCWYYWWVQVMNYAVRVDWGAMIYIPSFIKIGLGMQKLIGGDICTRAHPHMHTYAHTWGGGDLKLSR
jgi:hypothetical protein